MLDTKTTLASRTYIIGIAGGTGAGKTTLANAIIERVGKHNVLVIEHDRYYKDLTDLPEQDPLKNNYDHPASLDTALLTEHLKQLRMGHSIEVPIYDFSTFRRSAETDLFEPHPIVIVEGILLFVEDALRDELDLKLFIELNADERFLRRLERDIKERGRTPQSVIDQYRTSVRPMHDLFVEPNKKFADFIIQSEDIRNQVATVVAEMALSAISNQIVSQFSSLEEVGKQLLSVQAEGKPLILELVHIAAQSMNAISATLHQYSEENRDFLPVEKYSAVWPEDRTLRQPRSTGFTADLILSGETIKIYEDAESIDPEHAHRTRVHAYIGVRLDAGDELLGVLFLNYASRRSFTSFERIFAQLIGTFVALALQRDRAWSRITKEQAAVDFIRNISQRLLSSGTDVMQEIRLVVGEIATQMQADQVIFHQYDETQGDFLEPNTFSAAWGYDGELTKPRVEGISEYILKSTESVQFVEDVSELASELTKSLRPDIRAFIGLRLEVNRQNVGVVFLNYYQPQQFDDTRRRLISEVSSSLAAAIMIRRLIVQTTQSEREKREEEEAKKELAANVTHFTKGLVGFLRWDALDLLNENSESLTETQRELIRRIVRKADEAIRELETTLNAVRIDTAKASGVRELIDASSSYIDQNARNEVSLDINIPADLPMVNVNPLQIRFTLGFLLMNAINAIERAEISNGKIEIDARLEPDNDHIAILISDNGIAIPAEHRDAIFEGIRIDVEGNQRTDGIGNGLRIARALAKAQNGNLYLLETPDERKTFVLSLPVFHAE